MSSLNKDVESWDDFAIVVVFSLCFKINETILSRSCSGEELMETFTISGNASVLREVFAYSSLLPIRCDRVEKKMVYLCRKHSHCHLLYPTPKQDANI